MISFSLLWYPSLGFPLQNLTYLITIFHKDILFEGLLVAYDMFVYKHLQTRNSISVVYRNEDQTILHYVVDFFYIQHQNVCIMPYVWHKIRVFLLYISQPFLPIVRTFCYMLLHGIYLHILALLRSQQFNILLLNFYNIVK